MDQILADGERNRIRLAFIWNRSPLCPEAVERYSAKTVLLPSLDSIHQVPVDLIVEVCHPAIVHQYACTFLDTAHLLIGSPTALADIEFAAKLTSKLATETGGHRLFVARGALWGANDIQCMAQRNLLQV